MFTLIDEQGRQLNVKAEVAGSFLNLFVEGYGPSVPGDNYGQPVSLDWHNGKLQVLVNPDADGDEPQIISLEGCKVTPDPSVR